MEMVPTGAKEYWSAHCTRIGMLK